MKNENEKTEVLVLADEVIYISKKQMEDLKATLKKAYEDGFKNGYAECDDHWNGINW